MSRRVGPWIGHVVAGMASAASLIGAARLGTRGMVGPRGRLGPMMLEPLDPRLGVAALIVAVSIVAMRRWPRVAYVVAALALLGYGVVGGPAGGLYLPTVVITSLLVGRLGLRDAAVYLVAVPVVVGGAGLTSKELLADDLRSWWLLISGIVWALLPALGVAVLDSRKRAARREHEDALERAAANERLRLAREIHDVVGHSLSMISLQSGVALRVLDNDPAQVRASLEAIRGASKDALTELRHTLGVFRGDGVRSDVDDAPRTPTPTIPALGRLVDEVSAGGVRVTLAPLPDASGIGAAEQAVTFRIVQEALTNAVRHAPGQPVSVGVRREPDSLIITVENALPTGDPAPVVEGSGLRGMRERVSALGGTLVVQRRPASFVVTATLPAARKDA